MRKNKYKEKEKIFLFDFIKKADSTDEGKIAAKLYGKNKNAFYRLKNRLLTDLNKSLLLQHLNTEEDLSILQNLLLSRLFRQKQKNKVAEVYLKKAEKKAEQIEAYELLNLIYNELIKLSHDMISIDVEDYIEKKKTNNERLRRIHEIDDVLAAVMFRIRSAKNYSRNNAAIIDLLEKTVNEYTQTENLEISAKLRIKIPQAVSRVLLQKHDYIALEEYLLHMLEVFKKKSF